MGDRSAASQYDPLRGSYVGADLGVTWTKAGANLPLVPVHDINIQDQHHGVAGALGGAPGYVWEHRRVVQHADLDLDEPEARRLAQHDLPGRDVPAGEEDLGLETLVVGAGDVEPGVRDDVLESDGELGDLAGSAR